MMSQNLLNKCFCGKEIPHSSYSSRTKYCGRGCRQKAWYQKERHRIVKYPIIEARKCESCSVIFIPEKSHPKAKTCSLKCQKRLDYIENREKRIHKVTEWIRNNPDKIREYHRKNYARHIIKKRVQARVRNRGSISLDMWKRICDTHGNMCGLCEKEGNYQTFSIDHIIPLALGGTNDWWNIQPLCLRCNQSKGCRFIG